MGRHVCLLGVRHPTVGKLCGADRAGAHSRARITLRPLWTFRSFRTDLSLRSLRSLRADNTLRTLRAFGSDGPLRALVAGFTLQALRPLRAFISLWPLSALRPSRTDSAGRSDDRLVRRPVDIGLPITNALNEAARQIVDEPYSDEA
ncbi:hypothetical protein ASE66_25560 [Bosea sp. Root483D1]|nr:hypothetical protein ASE66_25560 [Bosea sp. Root483D1]